MRRKRYCSLAPRAGQPAYRRVSFNVPTQPCNDWEVAGLVGLGVSGVLLVIGAIVGSR